MGTALAAAALYASRLAPSIVLEGDSTELVSAAAVWGVPHAPGFPVYTAMLHLLQQLPFGSVAWRAHLASAFFHAGGVYAVALFAGRLAGKDSVVAAFVAGASLALSRAFFVASLYAEVFPLNGLFFALLLYLASEAQREDDATATQTLIRGGCLFGFALAHHPMILFGLPTLAILARRPLRRSPVAALAPTLAALAAFALSCGLIPLVAARHPPISTGDVHDLRSLVHLVLRLDYGGPLSASRSDAGPANVVLRVWTWAASFGRSASVLPLLALAGLLAFARRAGVAARPDAIALALAVVLPGPVFAAINPHFQQTDEAHTAIAERFTTMALVGLAPMVGLAAAEVVAGRERSYSSASGRSKEPRSGGRFRRLLTAAVLLAPIALLLPRVATVSFAAERRGLAYARDLLRPIPDNALVLVQGDVAGQAMLYVCNVEHACGTRIVIAPGLLPSKWYRTELARRYPGLNVPPTVRGIHDLVDEVVDVRPVFAVPGVLTKDPDLSRFTATPALLLLRLTRPDATKEAREDALSWAAAMDEDASGGCAGCRLDAKAVIHPSLAAGLPAEYAIAMRNHALLARDEGKRDLARRLEERADRLSPP
jgi:hypothetical protein